MLYIQGGRDALVSSEVAHQLTDRTPHSQLLFYPNLNHLELSEAFRRLDQPVIGWLDRYLKGSVRTSWRSPKAEAQPPDALSVTFCVTM